MNWNMLGHEWAVDLLGKHLSHDKVRHAYLFVGPLGVGRRTLALKFAQAINCETVVVGNGFCGECTTCKQISNLQHPDLLVVQAEYPGGVLKVDQIRDLQHGLSLSPYMSRYKIALILRVEEAHESAINALLKTLEEPPEHVVLLLTALSPEGLLPTLVSRCEVMRLRPLPVKQVADGLETMWGFPPDQANLLAHLSGGRPGIAVRFHDEEGTLQQRADWLNDHYRLLGASLVDRFHYADKMSKDKPGLQSLLQIWLSYWRDVLLCIAGSQTPATNIDRTAEIQHLSRQIGVLQAREIASKLDQTQDLLSKNVNTRLAMEVLLMSLPVIKPGNGS